MILKGANYIGYEYGIWRYGTPPDHQEAAYEQMKNWGFNVVKIPISWEYIEPSPGVYDDSYFVNHVDKDVAWAEARGMYIIFYMAQDGYSAYFNGVGSPRQSIGIGFPAWTCNGYPKTNAGLQKAVDDFWNGFGPNGTPASSSNPSMRDRYTAMWEHVAYRYTDRTIVAGYDLMDEPFYGGSFNDGNGLLTLQQTIQKKNDYFRQLIDGIRTVDTNHLFFNEPVDADWTVPDEAIVGTITDRPNVVYSFHFYDYNGGYDGQFSTLESRFLQRIWNPTINWNIPLWDGGHNSFSTSSNHDKYLQDMMAIFDKYQIGSAYHAYVRDNNYNPGLANADGGERWAVADIDTPYPTNSSISLTSYNFDWTSKAFSLQTQTGTGVQKITIYLPNRYYPGNSISSNIPVTVTRNPTAPFITLTFTLNSQALNLKISPT